MNAADISWQVLRISAKAFERLAQTPFVPWHAERYLKACNLPPLAIGKDWASGVTELRTEIETVDGGDPAVRDTKYTEFVSRLALVVSNLQLMIDTARHETSDLALIDIALRLYLPTVLWTLEDELQSSTAKHEVIAWIAVVLWGLVILDERVQEAYPQTISYDRWAAFLGDAWSKLGGKSRAESLTGIIGLVLMALEHLGLPIANGARHLFGGARDPLEQLGWPRDHYLHKGLDDHPAVSGLERTLESAKRTTVLFIGAAPRHLVDADYDKFDDDGALWAHRRFALAFVPRTDDDTGDAGGFYLQLTGDMQYATGGDGPGLRAKVDLTGGRPKRPTWGARADRANLGWRGCMGLAAALACRARPRTSPAPRPPRRHHRPAYGPAASATRSGRAALRPMVRNPHMLSGCREREKCCRFSQGPVVFRQHFAARWQQGAWSDSIAS